MAKLMITGALGHIGSRFIHSLKPGEFDEVHMIDNLSTQRYSSLFNLPENVRFKFIEDNICTANLDEYFKGIDIVIHLAALTDAPLSFDKKEEYKKVNYLGTERVAMACIKNECRLIFPSTTSVYGVQKDIVDEDCPNTDLRPQSPYAEFKLKTEKLLKKLGQEQALHFITCRFGTIFGSSIGMRFHTAVNKFCWQAAMGRPITVWQTALQQKRPYLDIIDATESLKFIIKKNLFDGNIYNVLTVNSSVREIVEVISSYVKDVYIKYVDTKIMNQLSYNVSTKRFKALGFVFKGNLRKQIGETLQLFKALRHQ